MQNKTEIFTVYTVHRENNDRYNGPITDVCSTKELAKQVAHGSGWYGGDAPIETRSAVKIDGKVYLLHVNRPVDLDGKLQAMHEELKKSALQKLTADEIEALGIDLNAL